MGEQKYHALLDTNASNSFVAEREVEQGQTQMGEIFGVKVGNGAVQLTSGETEGVVHMEEEDIPYRLPPPVWFPSCPAPPGPPCGA